MSNQKHPYEPAGDGPDPRRCKHCGGEPELLEHREPVRFDLDPPAYPDTGQNPPPFDHLADEGITAYFEEMARNVCPDDEAKQMLIVEGLRALSGRNARAAPPPNMPQMASQMASGIMPGLLAPNRFFIVASQPPAPPIQVFDFFSLFQTSWKISIIPLDNDSRVTLHRNSGGTTQLDPPESCAFLEFLRPYGIIR